MSMQLIAPSRETQPHTVEEEGGAIYGYEIDVKDSKFENNIANYAGAIYCDNAVGEDDYEQGLLKISNCSFISNKEGAVRSPKIIVNNSKTFNNKTLDNGLKAMSPFKVTADKLVTVYYSGKTLKIKVLTNPSGKPAKKLQLLVVVKSSKKTYSILCSLLQWYHICLPTNF